LQGAFSILKISGDLESLSKRFLTVVADGFDGTGGERLFAQLALFFRLGLLKDVRVTVIVRACKIVWRCVTAHIAIYAERINIVRAGNILLDPIIRISQSASKMQ
jgi:hypothetical protein